MKNIRYAFRSMGKRPGLTLSVLLTLVLGIGANTAIFTVDYATLLSPGPYPNAGQLVNIWSKPQGRRSWVSGADFMDWKEKSTAFQDMNAWGPEDFNIATRDRPEFVEGMRATPGYYGMLGTPFFLGRNFLPEEGRQGKDHVVILTHRLWQRLGADARIIGRELRVNGELYKVVGVLAAGTADRRDEELTVPLVFSRKQLANRDSRGWVVTGRMKSGTNIQRAQANMDLIAANLAQDYPKTNKGFGALVDPLKNDFFPRKSQLTLWLLLGAVGFLLLMACLNVANLLLAAGITRQREVAIRCALGASRTAILTQFLTESEVLAVLGGLMGVGAGYSMLRGLVAVMPPHALPPEADLGLNIPVLIYALGAATVAGLLFGGAPAWYASRLDPASGLKEGGRSGIRTGRQRLRVLVIAEFAVALPLLAGAGLTMRSFWNLTHVDVGFRTDHVLGFYLTTITLSKNPDQTTVISYYRRLLAGIGAVPGVLNVCAMSFLPLDNLNYGIPITIAGRPEGASPSQRLVADLDLVTPDYFQTFGIRILKGRGFTDADNAARARVAMVNEEFADRFLQGVDPLKQRVMMKPLFPGEAPPGEISGGTKGEGNLDWQIVGVFRNVKSRGSRENFPEIKTPFWQEAFEISGIGIRTAGDPQSMIRGIAAAVNAVDPEAAIYRPRTMTQIHDEVLANDRFTAVLFAIFAAVALLLATVGTYSVMAFSVTERSREIQLRMALGASRRRVIGLVMTEGMLLACAGSGLGLIGAYFVGRTMQSVLFDVQAVDHSTFVVVGLFQLAAALLACCLPAFSAASMETMELLRSE
jgi:putative ABC transport system permease protein